MFAASQKFASKAYATTYDREQCEIGFVHLGYGAFHRAHQAVYIDDYMQITGDLNCAIAAVNLRHTEATAFQNAQETVNGYLLKTTSPQGEREYRMVRSHRRFVDWSKDAEDAERLLCMPSVHSLSVTVTESGYYLNDDWSLNIDHPVISSEIAGTTSVSIYSYLAKAIRHRCETIDQPLNVICCDNIRSNGHMLESNFLSYLKHTGDNQLRDWVADNVSFPCSMVDRITPRATDELNAEIANNFPGELLNPIHGEQFTQWVLEDNFKAPMPDLTCAGVEIVDDIDPYEEAKIRILNGGHTGLCYFGALAGHTTFDEAFNDPALRAIFDAFETDEVLPGLDLDLPFDKQGYLAEISSRFSNSAIADQLERICMDGYSKMPIYIRPTLESCLRQNILPVNTINCIASWYIYARRFASAQTHIHYHEPYWDQLAPLLVKGQEEHFAMSKQLWATVPESYPQFVSTLLAAIQEMETKWPA